MKLLKILKGFSGFSIIESLGSLAAISIAIVGVLSAARYVYDLQYALHIKTIDRHFDRIQRLLAYENCESFIGDSLKKGVYKDLSVYPGFEKSASPSTPVIIDREPCAAAPCPVEILYAEKDSIFKDGESARGYLSGEPDISIQSIGIVKALVGGYYDLEMVFHSAKGAKSSLRKKGGPAPAPPKQGEVTRALRVYFEVDSYGIIQGCSLSPLKCKEATYKIFPNLVEHAYTSEGIPVEFNTQGGSEAASRSCMTGRKISAGEQPDPDTEILSLPLSAARTGKFQKGRYHSEYCLCWTGFYCRKGTWELSNIICNARP